MSTNIGTEENPVMVFVRYAGGMLDATVRAPDRATFEAAAKTAELLVEVEPGVWVNSIGVHFDHLGPVTIKPGTYAADGSVITAAVVDARHHVNIRMAPPSTLRVDENGKLKWHNWALAWTATGEPDQDQNASEDGRVLMGVSLIDPDSISSPSRVWL